jgi:hypothetical protein
MNLSQLRGAIRKMKGNPSVVIELTPGVPMTLVIQKTPTLETLGHAYGEIKGDIGLTLDEHTGIISGPMSPTLIPVFGDGLLDLEEVDDDEDML